MYLSRKQSKNPSGSQDDNKITGAGVSHFALSFHRLEITTYVSKRIRNRERIVSMRGGERNRERIVLHTK